jgi:hypothetical protein
LLFVCFVLIALTLLCLVCFAMCVLMSVAGLCMASKSVTHACTDTRTDRR